MKKVFLFLIMFFILQIPSFAKDTILKSDGGITGHITDYIDGLVQINRKGMEYTLTRSKGDEFYGDFIQYRKSPFKKAVTVTYCRVTYIDSYSVEFLTPTDKAKIPRYRVKNIILNYK